MISKVLVFGDSHVRLMAAPNVVVDFFGVPGLNAYELLGHFVRLLDFCL